MDHAGSPIPSCAVIFRTHFWDAFVARQFERLRRQVQHADIFVLVDETGGRVEGITHDRVVRLTEADVLASGLARRGEQNILWFNGDYPLYYFRLRHPHYEYYFQLEYDVLLNVDIDGLIARMAADHADFAGLTKGDAVPDWYWRNTCADAYAMEDVRWMLICCCFFSRQALERLYERRLALSRDLGDDQAWPFCEAFIATEIALAGLKSVELSTYLDTSAYDHWPPYVEYDPQIMGHPGIVHPLLNQRRYTDSLLKYKVGLSGFLNPLSLYHRKLRRLPLKDYIRVLLSSFTVKARRTLGSLRA